MNPSGELAALDERAVELRKQARAKGNQEMGAINTAQWHGQVSAKSDAIRLASQSHTLVLRLIDGALEPLDGGEETQEAARAIAEAQLDLAGAVLSSRRPPEMRIAQAQGYLAGMDEQRRELRDAVGRGPAQTAETVKEVISTAKATSELLRKMAADPLGYYSVAEKFINGTLAKKLPKVLSEKLPSAASTGEFIEFLKRSDLGFDDFQKVESILGKASRFLGVAQVGLTVVTVVFETLANQGDWATHFTSAAVAAGSSAGLEAVITGSAVATAISSTLSAAGLTVEVPPVAAALIAAGIVVVVSIAITELFDSLVSLIFGPTTIPRSMRMSMSTPTYVGMSSRMSSDMAASMLARPEE